MQAPFSILAFLFFSFVNPAVSFGQTSNGFRQDSIINFNDSSYIKRLDTLLHLKTWISANQMKYTLVYSKDFKLVLAPNKINSLSFGLSYRYLDLGFSITPGFLNPTKTNDEKGESEQFSFRTSFQIQRFNLSMDLSSVKGFYLKNSKEFQRTLPDSAYIIYPDLMVKYFSLLLRYNINPKFSTASLAGGTQIQLRSAYTMLPSLQFATFKFKDNLNKSGVQNEDTYSTDLNLLLPVVGTLVFSPGFSATMGIGPSIGVDFFKSVALNDSNKVVLSKGTEFTFGYTFQTAISYHLGRLYLGFEYQNRRYGHEIEDVSKLIKQYSYFQFYLGWRLKAHHFAKKSLDWINKISPVDFD